MVVSFKISNWTEHPLLTKYLLQFSILTDFNPSSTYLTFTKNCATVSCKTRGLESWF